MFLQFHVVIFDFVIRPRTDMPVLVELVHLLRNSHTSILATQSEELDCETPFNAVSIEKSRHTPYRRSVRRIHEQESEDVRGPDVNGQIHSVPLKRASGGCSRDVYVQWDEATSVRWTVGGGIWEETYDYMKGKELFVIREDAAVGEKESPTAMLTP
jgi:hypothetical protein